MNIGIIQSRLSPIDLNRGYQYFPEMWWDNEFKLAKLYGFSHIEWIYDDNPNNLLNTDEGINEILNMIKSNQINVECICADYFIKKPFWSNNTEAVKVMNMLIVQAFKLGVKNIILPLIEESTLIGEKKIAFGKEVQFISNMKLCLETAGRYMVNICLETDLKPTDVFTLVQGINSDRLGICHDTGNLIEVRYDESNSFGIYHKYVKHIHLKDKKIRRPANVEIGTGDVTFRNLFKYMDSVKYDGTVTLQCARKEYDLEYIKKQFNKIKQEYNCRESARQISA